MIWIIMELDQEPSSLGYVTGECRLRDDAIYL